MYASCIDIYAVSYYGICWSRMIYALHCIYGLVVCREVLLYVVNCLCGIYEPFVFDLKTDFYWVCVFYRGKMVVTQQ